MAIQLTTLGPPDGFQAVNYIESNFFSSSTRPDGQSWGMHFQIAPTDYVAFEKAALGFCYFDGALIRRYQPLVNYYKGWQVARTVDYVQPLCEPTTDANGHLTYAGLSGQPALLEIAVGFEAPQAGMQFLFDSQRPAGRTDELWRNVGRRIEHEITSQQLPRNALAYAAGSLHPNKPIPGVGAVVLATATLYYTVDFPVNPASVANGFLPIMSGSLEANLAAGEGTINSATFDGQYPKYTILALAPKRELIWQADGSLAWRMTYIFAQRGTLDVSGSDADSATPDWTRILNGGTTANTYSRVNKVGAPAVFAYATSDLNKLFTP